MKKFVSLILALTMLLLCGCGNSGEANLFDQMKSLNGENAANSQDTGEMSDLFSDMANGSKNTGGANGPEKVVKQFIDAVNNNNLNTFLNCLPPDTRDAAESELEYALEEGMTLKDMLSDGERIHLTVHGLLMVGTNYALVDNSISYDGYEDREPVACCKIDGKWYLDMNYDYEHLAAEGATGASSPEKVVNALIDAINKDDAQAFISITNPEHRLEMAEDLFEDVILEGATMAEALYGEEGVKLKVKINDVYKDGDEAEVACTITVDNGYEESGEFKCIRVDGKWYLYDL